MRTSLAALFVLGGTLIQGTPVTHACTNFLITRGASADGSTMITYAADSHTLYGDLVFHPARKYPAGAKLKIFDWDTGKYLGEIAQARQTYQVVGNMNEHQVAIGETTFGGREELQNPLGGIDYGNLMYVALQRARTAREAIQTIGQLVATYGYFSHGESFSISDPREVWIMDLVGKGPKHKGAVWVARRVPDGFVSAHANHARITTFPLKDPDNCLYAGDVISFARQMGLFKGKDEAFSFTDTYAPADFGALRWCEARVWRMFDRVAPKLKLKTDYVKGVKGAGRLPLWVKPEKLLAVHDVMELMRDHFEGTEFDLSKGIGAGPYRLPYRWRPLEWKVKGVTYFNERATATQQTGFSFVAQARSWLPNPIGGVLWFSVDDAASTVYVPIYCGITEVPKSYAVGTADFTTFSWDSAFWVFNFVANFAYARYADVIKDIRRVQRELERKFLDDQPRIEKAALALHARAPAGAIRYLTRYSVEQGEAVTRRWRRLGEELLVKYLDGNVRDAMGKVTHPGYPADWYRRIAQEGGERLKVKEISCGCDAEQKAREFKRAQEKKAREQKAKGKKGPSR